MTNSKLLIVSYKLGTSDGVGGRRWLFYGLELIKKGHDVFFLTYEKELPQEIYNVQEKVFFIRSNYPEVLKSYPKSLLNKLTYRFWIFVLSKFNKGAIYDEAARTQKTFLEKTTELIIEKNITHLLISGAPFSLLYFGTLIKQKFPHIVLICDYRDSWTQGIGYGIKELPAKKFQYELYQETEVLKRADKILVASKDIGIALNKIAPGSKPIVVRNFVDGSQFPENSLAKKVEVSENVITLTHIGSVNRGLKKYWEHFLKNLERTIKYNSIKVVCQFIGGKNKELEEYVKNNNLDFVVFLPNMQKTELATYLMSSDIFVFFKHDEFPHSFPTKFFDYLLFKKPLICYSIPGDVTEELIVNNLGTVFNENTTFDLFSDKVIDFKKNKNSVNVNYDSSKFGIENCVIEIENALKL
jgi:hypothetical protein